MAITTKLAETAAEAVKGRHETSALGHVSLEDLLSKDGINILLGHKERGAKYSETDRKRYIRSFVHYLTNKEPELDAYLKKLHTYSNAEKQHKVKATLPESHARQFERVQAELKNILAVPEIKNELERNGKYPALVSKYTGQG